MLHFCNWKKKCSLKEELLFWEICFPFKTNNKNLGKRVKNQNHNVQYTGTQQTHFSDVSLYPTLIIQASSRLKLSANHLWNNSDVCRKKFGEWSPLPDNFQMREHSWPCRFHINYYGHSGYEIKNTDLIESTDIGRYKKLNKIFPINRILSE